MKPQSQSKRKEWENSIWDLKEKQINTSKGFPLLLFLQIKYKSNWQKRRESKDPGASHRSNMILCDWAVFVPSSGWWDTCPISQNYGAEWTPLWKRREGLKRY